MGIPVVCTFARPSTSEYLLVGHSFSTEEDTPPVAMAGTGVRMHSAVPDFSLMSEQALYY